MRRSEAKGRGAGSQGRGLSLWGGYLDAGVTPMLQLLRAVLSDPQDPTQCFLLFANQVGFLLSVLGCKAAMWVGLRGVLTARTDPEPV